MSEAWWCLAWGEGGGRQERVDTPRHTTSADPTLFPDGFIKHARPESDYPNFEQSSRGCVHERRRSRHEQRGTEEDNYVTDDKEFTF